MHINWVQVTPGKYRCTVVIRDPSKSPRPVWSASVTAVMDSWTYSVRPPAGNPISGSATSREQACQGVSDIIFGVHRHAKRPEPPAQPQATYAKRDGIPALVACEKPSQGWWGICPRCGATISGSRSPRRTSGPESFLRSCSCGYIVRVTAESQGSGFRSPVSVEVVREASKPVQEEKRKAPKSP